MRLIHYIRVLALLAVLASIPACSTTPMSKQEAADWYSRYHLMVRWVGYQGSDEQYHHYIARVMDDWAFIRIKKDELRVSDERPYSKSSSAPFCYYRVDPRRDYAEIEP